MEVIARIHNDFPAKFGLPRQSGLAPSLRSKIVFEPAYRVAEALRGLDGFSHIWLIWQFSESVPAHVGLVEKSAFLVAGALDRHEGSDFASEEP